LRKSYKQRQTK